MRPWIMALALVLAGLGLAACAAKQEAPPPPPAAPAPEAKPAWQEEWERVLAAAKREGKVVMFGPVGAAIRRALTEPFEKRYGISVEYQGGGGPEFPPRLEAERKAGQYLWDIYVGGATHMFRYKPLGFYDPLEPTLILPEAKEPKGWQGGRGLYFLDKDRIMLAFNVFTATFFVNPNQTDPRQFRSWKDLLDPRYKGKVVLHDPRIAGAGQSRFQFFFLHKDLGPDFIRALAPQLVLTRDYDHALNSIATGQNLALIGAHDTLADQKMKEGLPIAMVNPEQLREGGIMSAGVGHTVLINRAPHPNAAKVYVNWLLTKEGQTEFTKAAGLPSLRVDVPTEGIHPYRFPKVGYWDSSAEATHLARDPIAAFAKEIFGE